MNGQSIPSTTKLAFYLVLALTWIQISVAPARGQTEFVAGETHLARPRIVERIDDSVAVRIPNSTPRALRNAVDQGRLDGSTKVGPVFLILKSSPEQEEALQTLLDQQQDKSTPNYHRWLTPDEFGAAFGAEESDLQQITDWLTNEGFELQHVARGRRSIVFTGTVAQVEQAFHTEIHSYLVQGKRHFSNNTEISIPRALSPLLLTVSPLDDFKRFQSKYTVEPCLPFVACTHFMSPGDFATIYNTEPLLELGYDGTGVKIAIIGWSDVNLSDVATFRSIFLPAKYAGNQVVIFNPYAHDPGITSDDEGEDVLDVEWAGAVAPGAQIELVSSTDRFLEEQAEYVIENNTFDIISVSRGACEKDMSSLNGTFNALWEQAAAQGITVFVGAGDSGSADCDAKDAQKAQHDYGVNGLASTPYNVAVGGTEFDESDGTSSYWNLLNHTTPFGLTSTSATGYVPEVVWNESGAQGGSGLWAGGGGVSTLYPTPPWQAGVIGLPPTGLMLPFPPGSQGQPRYLPDVSLTASSYDGYIVCQADKVGCSEVLGSLFSFGIASGTSAATPAFAGIQALIDQAYRRQGQANYVYYNLAAKQDMTTCNSLRPGGPGPNCVFNDIIVGANSVPCLVTGSDNYCTTGILQNYNATTGYDLASGLGSVNAVHLFDEWMTANPSATRRDTTTTVNLITPASGVATYGQTVTFWATVSVPDDAWGPPLTGQTVTFSGMSCSETQSNTGVLSLKISRISATPITTYWNYVASCTSKSLPVGTDSVSAAFSPGDLSTYYRPSQSTAATVTVQQQPSLPTLTGLTINPSTIATGNSATVTATLSGSAPSTGAQVNLYPSNPSAFPAPSSFTIPSGQSSGSSSPIVAGTVGTSTPVVVNGFYNSGTQQATVVVNPSANIGLTIALNASQTTVNAGQSVTLTATFTGATKGTPSGLAHFYDYFNGVATNIGNVSISSGGQYSATSSTGSLLAGQHAFTVIYNGDSNYSSAISNVVNVTVQQQSQGSLVLSNFTITPATIVGGYFPQGNVFLTGNAPAGGAVVSITSTENHFIQVPPTVTVTPGYNSRAFPITTSFTSGTLGATITASYNGTMYGAGLTVLPVAVSGVTFYPSTVTAGNSAPLTVYLTGPAAAGTSISLTSSNPSLLQVPSTVPLTTGATSISVTGTTSSVGLQTTFTVTASYNNSSAQGALTVMPAPPLAVNSFNFSPSTVTGGSSASGQVTLTALAPTGGVNVALNSASGLVQVPSTVHVPAGAWYAPVTAQTSTVNSITNVTVTASYGGSSQNATLTLVPPVPFLASLSLNPILVNSGSSSTGTVTLTAPPPLEGIEGVVNLTSNAPYAVAHVLQIVVVQPGNTSANFTIGTSAISFIAPVTITASYNGTSQSVLLTVVPPGTPLAPSLLTLNPPTVTGGTNSNGTITLVGPAPAGGAVIAVSSGNSAVQAPLTVTVPPGFTSATFTLTTSAVSVISTATITATLNGVSQSSLLTVKPSGSPPASNPVPFLTSPLMPVSQTPGGTGFSFTIDGVGFVPGAQVLWNDTALPTTYVSSSELQAAVSGASVQTNGTAQVVVSNPGQLSLLSNPLPEHLTYATSAPAFTSSSLAVSGSPYSVALGDFNGDGKLDLVVGKSDGSGLSIFLGNGDGTFGPERIISLPVPMTPYQVAVADFNGDGKLDIVYNRSGSSNGVIGILLGNGDGTFTAMPDISLPTSPSNNAALAVGDFNGDGALDLVVTGEYLAGAYVLLGNGDGTFRSPQSVGSVYAPLSVAVADFNGDGKLDIALTDFSNQSVAILLGNGDGTFQAQKEYPANGYPYSVCVADFNGDGHPDIAVAEAGPYGGTGSGAAILLNTGSGTFSAPVNYGVGQGFYFIASDDLNGDGKLDLVVAQVHPSQSTLLFLGNGDGSFSSTPITLSTGAFPVSIALADLNADGGPDVVAASNNINGSVPILLQTISPIIKAVPANASFTATAGDVTTSPVSLTISNTGGGTETWSALASQPWVVLSQGSGTAPSTINVTANPSSLSAGTYTGTITVSATGAPNSPQTVQVSLTVNPVPVVVESLAFSPTVLTGPGTATGTVTLSSPAPAGGVMVSLSSATSAVQVPSTTPVAAGLLSGGFTAAASAVTAQTYATVTASYNGVSTTAMLTVNPAPTLVSLSPSSVTVGGAAFTLTVTGTNFVSGSTVQWNGSARATTFVSSTQLTAAISASDITTAGTVSVTVVNPAPGGGMSNALTFTINNPMPTATLLSPSSATAGGGAFTLTVTGTNFVSGSTVQWNGSARTTTFVSGTQLTAAISASDIATGGTVSVTVVNTSPGGGTSSPLTFTINNPVPTATLLSPSSATAGGAALTLTVTGTNFVSGSTVQWKGSARTTTFVSGTQLTAAIPASDIAAAGTVSVTVVNTSPGGGTSNSLTFTINNPVPTVSLLSPSSVTAGAAAQTLTINGTNFVSTSTVTYHAVAHTPTFISSTQLTITLSASDQATAGTYAVVVTNPAPGGGASNSVNFTVNNSVPTITSLSPTSATAGAAAQTLTINGTNFLSTATVTYNGVAHTQTFVSSTQLKITLSTTDQATAGTYAVVVTDPAPGGGPSNAVNFTVNNSVPTISSLSPSSATAGAAAQALTINGTKFLSTSTVTYNGVAHTPTFVSSTQFKITLSATDQATAGTYPVVVTNPAPGGGPSNSVNFAVNNSVPTITSLSPASAMAGAAAQTLTINGTKFVSTSTVTYHAVAHTPTYVSSTQLTITLSTSDQATGGTYAVVVTNPAPGGGASNSVNFTVNNSVPTITSLSPASATAGAAAQTLTINGTNFVSTSAVTYHAVAHTPTFVSSTQLKITLSASDQATAGTYAVVVTNPAPGGGASNSVNFTVNNSVPTITSLSPASATAGAAAQTLTINGTKFVSTSTVTYNGVAHTPTFVSSTQLKITLSTSDQATAGTYVVVVTDPAPGGGASNSVNFTVNNSVPTITSLSPASAMAGAAAQTLTINGTKFLSTSTVTYNGVAHTSTFVSSTQLKITLSTSDQGTAGTHAVVVTDPAPGGGPSNAVNFTVNNSVPTITSLSPTSAMAGAAAQTLTINGTKFLSTSTVTYHAVAHTPTYVSSTQLTITLSTSDQATGGTYAVVVTNPAPGGGASNSVNFTVNNSVPTITSLSPALATAGAAAQTLTINGTNFVSTSAVTYHAVAHTPTFVSSTQLKITLSASDQATAGTYAVVVTNPAPGGGASNSVNFTVNNFVPTITSLSPTSATAGAAAQTLTINGTKFVSTSTVTYNSVAHTPTFVSSTQLKITLSTSDQATAGTYVVVVTDPAPGGGASNSVNFTVNNSVPTITSLSPASAMAGAAAQTLTINGTKFLSTSTVTYSGVAHTSTFVSSTQLKITLSTSDQGTAGTHAVVVTDPAPGGGPSNAVNFTVNNSVPTITSLSPTSAMAGAAAQTLTINGTKFLSTSTVTYHAVAHTPTFISSTQLTITLSTSDQATGGTYAVVVTNPAPGGGASNSVNFTVNNSVPTITSLSPSSATAGAAAETLTINGTNFVSTSAVTYHAVAHTPTFVSSTQLTIALSASDQATAGTYAVVVTNPAPGGGASNSVNFTVNNFVPTITSLSPTSAMAGAAAQTLTINGTKFLSTSTVTYNSVAHTPTFVSSTQLKITLSTSDQATAGTYAVVVTNPAPGGGASNSVNFPVNNSVPTISSLSPTSATAGAAAQTLTINGTKFLSTSTVTYNAVAHTPTFVSSTQLKIILSASDQATAGTYAVVVTNPAPGGGASNSVNFTVNNSVPTITSLSPASATAGAAAQTLTINGTKFLSTSTVTYHAVAHTPTFISSTQLTITLSAGDQATAGTYAVVVTNPAPGGGASNSVNFTVNNSVAGVSPSSLTFGRPERGRGNRFAGLTVDVANISGHYSWRSLQDALHT